jgi:hypothetical protein
VTVPPANGYKWQGQANGPEFLLSPKGFTLKLHPLKRSRIEDMDKTSAKPLPGRKKTTG